MQQDLCVDSKEGIVKPNFPQLLGCQGLKKDCFDNTDTDLKTSLDTLAHNGANYADFVGVNAFGSIPSDRRSFTKEIELQSVDCNVSCSDLSDAGSQFNFGTSPLLPPLETKVPSLSEAMPEAPVVPVKSEVAAPVKEQPVASKLYKTPNYKGKKKSNINYVTKHSTSDLKSHEALMKKKYGVKLSVRKDVVNKTLFRSLKRYYTDLFLKDFTLSKKESAESYLKKVKTFSSQIFAENLQKVSGNVTYEQIEKFLSILISPNHVKNLLTEAGDLALHKEFYSCLYQYSHKKLAKMLMNPICGYLFSDFITSGNLTQFIST